VVVLENKTGRVLAMSGGFSYPLSQLNRVTQAQRQPGSAIKPLSYLAALQRLQPNTYISDDYITLPPIGGSGRAREQDYWTPRNYDGGGGGTLTLRRALENSRNLATVHLLEGGIDTTPEASLERLCGLALEAQIYKECQKYYPFVLGAQPVRPIDLAAFYAAIANEGVRPVPHTVESIERNGLMVYRPDPKQATAIGSADRVSFYQLKTMMQGVLSRGTARSIASLAPYVAGKTGTSDDANDVWFVGFTNDVTVAVWVGYDNSGGKRRTLGGASTGGSVAVPIFEPIIQAVWANHSPKTALAPPSPEAKRQMVCTTVAADPYEPTQQVQQTRGGRGATECLRIDRTGHVIDTQYQLVSREESYGDRGYYSTAPNPFGWFQSLQQQFYDQRRESYNDGYGRQVPREAVRPPAQNYGQYRRDPRAQQQPQRVEPNFFWGFRRF
jgi:penicillin-binding protein 1A